MRLSFEREYPSASPYPDMFGEEAHSRRAGVPHAVVEMWLARVRP